MTIRERVLAVLRRETPDQVPWLADTSWYYCCHAGLTSHYAGKSSVCDLDPRYLSEGLAGRLQMHRDLDVGIYPLTGGVGCRQGGDVAFEQTRDAKEPDLIREVWRTPLGALESSSRELADSTAHLDYPAKSAADLKIVRYVFEHRSWEADDPQWRPFHAQEAEIGDLGISVVVPPQGPLAHLFGVWMGVRNTVYAMADDPEEVEKTLDCIAESHWQGLQVALQCPCALYSYNDNISSENIGSYFRRYALPFYQRATEAIHAAEKCVYLHTDGTVRGLLPLVEEAGFDCAEAVTPEPVGDVPPERVRDGLSQDFIIWGGVPGAVFAPPFGPDEMRAHIRRLLDTLKPGGPFVMGVADLVPPNGDIELLKVVAEVVEEFGHY